jgi:hypothetical protein
MILGLEIGLFIFGILALVRGRMTLTKSKVVEGVPARLIGMLALTPLPVAFLIGVAYAIIAAPADPEKFAEDNKWTLMGIEAAIVIGVAIMVFVIGMLVAVDPKEARRRKRRYEDEDDEAEDDYDRPRRRRSRDEEEDDENESGRPRRRRRRDDDEDDEYERPLRR